MAALGLSLLLGACAGGKTAQRDARVPVPLPPIDKPEATSQQPGGIAFPSSIRVPPQAAVDDPKDPQQVVLLALALVDRQEFRQAAAFFLEAAQLERAKSLRNEFRIATLAAAASALLQAGDLVEFQQVVERLKKMLDRFQLAALPPEVAVLLAIADRRQGTIVRLPATLAYPVRELFQD